MMTNMTTGMPMFLGLVPAEYIHAPLAAHAIQYAADLKDDAVLLGDALGKLDPKAGLTFHKQFDVYRYALVSKQTYLVLGAREAMRRILPETDAAWGLVLQAVQEMQSQIRDDGFEIGARVYLPGHLLEKYVDGPGRLRAIDSERARFLQKREHLADRRDIDALERGARLAFVEDKDEEWILFTGALAVLSEKHTDPSFRKAAADGKIRLADFVS